MQRLSSVMVITSCTRHPPFLVQNPTFQLEIIISNGYCGKRREPKGDLNFAFGPIDSYMN